MKRRAKLVVSGHVQGVFFRASARELAATLGLAGYVRNLQNMDVEIVAEGEEAALGKLIEWARQGPIGAAVGSICVDYSEVTDLFSGFEIRY